MSDSAVGTELRKSSPRRKKKGSNYESSIVLNKTHTQYVCIPRNAKALGWVPISDSSVQRSGTPTLDSTNDSSKSESSAMPVRSGVDWNVYWTDSGLHIDKLVRTAKTYQKLNHFPGMVHIYRKSNLARSMARMQKIDSSAYDFYPKTWILPSEKYELQLYLKHNINNARDKDRCVIVKPSGGAQGKGIYLAIHPHDILPTDDAVAQVYVPRPLLIDGFKFDLRIYALITCVDPLRILLYREGLVRLCTTPYEAPNIGNADCAFMHLTNYAVNKHNDGFVQNDGRDEDEASKRSLSWLWGWMEERDMDAYGVWQNIADVIVKSLISIQAGLAQSYRACKVDTETRTPFTCFELLGFDIMLTSSLKPILIEVNHSPSFRTDSKLDATVKNNLIKNTLLLLNVNIGDRQKFNLRKAALSQIRLYGNVFDRSPEMKSKLKGGMETRVTQWENYLSNERAHRGNFDLIYPVGEYRNQPTSSQGEVYKRLLQAAHNEHWGINIDLLGGLSPTKTSNAMGDKNDDNEKNTATSPSTTSIATANSNVKKSKAKSPEKGGSSPPSRISTPAGTGTRSPRPKTPTNKEGEQAWGRNPATTSPRTVRSRDPSPGALETVENEKVAMQGGYGQEEQSRVKSTTKPKVKTFIARQEKNAYHSKVSLVRPQEDDGTTNSSNNEDKISEVVIRASPDGLVGVVQCPVNPRSTTISATISIDSGGSSGRENDADVTDRELSSPNRDDDKGESSSSHHSKDIYTCEDGNESSNVITIRDDRDREEHDRGNGSESREREMTNFEKRLCKIRSVATASKNTASYSDSDRENDGENCRENEQDSSQIEPEINLYASSDSSTSFDGNMLQSLDVLPTMRIIDDSHGDDDDISFTQSNEAETGLESDPPTSLSHAISVCVDALEDLHNTIIPQKDTLIEQQQQQQLQQQLGGSGSSEFVGFGDTFSREPALRCSPRTLPSQNKAEVCPLAPVESIRGQASDANDKENNGTIGENSDKMDSLRLKYSAFREEWLNTYRSAVHQNNPNQNQQQKQNIKQNSV